MTPEEETATWPYWLRKFAQIIGPERTRELAARYGGLDAVYLPKLRFRRHLWLGVLTEQELAALGTRHGGQYIAIPQQIERESGKKQKILELVGQGLSDREIAMRVHATQRTVRRVRTDAGVPSCRAREKVDPRQTRMFD